MMILRLLLQIFGFVTALPESIGSTTVVTAASALSLAWSRGYLAPEISDRKHGAASDVYSYRVVIFCLVNARMLYRLGCVGEL